MTESKKLAVSFGSFACVIEGYDHPFSVMQRVVAYFQDMAEEDPSFGKYDEIDDFQHLREVLGGKDHTEIQITPIAGGVYVRNLTADGKDIAPAAIADQTDEAPADGIDSAEDAKPEVTELRDGVDVGEDIDVEHHDADAHELHDRLDTAPDEEETAEDVHEGAPDDASFDDEGDHDQDESVADEGPGTDLSMDDDGRYENDAAGTELMEDADGAPEYDVAAEHEDHTPEEEPDFDTADEADQKAAILDSASEDFYFTPSPEKPNTDANSDQWNDATGEGDDTPAAVEAFAEGADTDVEPPETTTSDEDLIRSLALGDFAVDPADANGHTDNPDTIQDLDEMDALADDVALEDAAMEGDDALLEDLANGLGSAEESQEPYAPHIRSPQSDDDIEDGKTPADVLTLRPNPGEHADALRLGPELAREDGEEETELSPEEPSFIDSVAEKPETKVLFKLKAKKPPAEIPDDLDLSELRSSLSPEQANAAPPSTEVEPAQTGGPLRALGAMFKRGGPDEGDAPPSPSILGDASKPSASEFDQTQPPEETEADQVDASPRGGILRVIQPNANDGTPSAPRPANQDAEPESALGGLRGLLTGKSEETPEADAAAADRARKAEGPSIEDRLHSSFTKPVKSNAGPVFNLDPIPGEDDEFTPRGFARKIGATTLPELMGAASAFLILVEDRATVSRNDIMDMVKTLAGDTPLTAETKIKAFGKLVRSGDLIRVEAGQFSMSPEARARYSAVFGEDMPQDDFEEGAL
ncbi:MAG: hypothetical protein AAGB10_02130 [Pseudomonadota bacterium]